jgi:hypothetical protein
MNPDEGMNLAIFNAEEIVLRGHQIDFSASPYHLQRLCQFYLLSDQLVYTLLFWSGYGGCGVFQSEKH